MDYGLTWLPPTDRLDWSIWDTVLGEWVQSQYEIFWMDQWKERALTDTQVSHFWRMIWSQFCRQAGYEDNSGKDATLRSLLDEISKDSPRSVEIIGEVSSNIRRLCMAAGVPLAGPAWAMFPPGVPPSAREDASWDIPWQVLGIASELSISRDDIVAACLSTTESWPTLRDQLNDLRNSQSIWEFWFPLSKYRAPESGIASIQENIKVVAIDASQVDQFGKAQGLQNMPSPVVGDLFAVISVDDPSWSRAYEVANHQLAQFQSMMRVADTRFRWRLTDYFFWTNLSMKERFSEADIPLFAEWRDPYRLRPSFPVGYFSKVDEWMNTLRSHPGELAVAAADSLYWQGIAYDQDAVETSVISWWIPIERIGNGSHNSRDLVPKLAGWLWHVGMWSAHSTPWQGFYQDQQRIRKLVHQLQKQRNEIVHQGRPSGKVDLGYVQWLLRHLAHDLTIVVIQLIQEEGLTTTEELSQWLDKQMGFQA